MVGAACWSCEQFLETRAEAALGFSAFIVWFVSLCLCGAVEGKAAGSVGERWRLLASQLSEGLLCFCFM